MFQNSVRAEMKAENPEIDHKGLAKVIGERWQAMGDAEKDVSRRTSLCCASGCG